MLIHLAKKCERAFLMRRRRDGWETAFCLQSFLLVNAFQQAKMAFTSLLTCSVMSPYFWSKVFFYHTY